MLENWVNFHKEKPKFTTEYDDLKYSDQLVFYINDKIYLGFYMLEKAYEDEDKWYESIEIAQYSHISLIEDFLPIKEGCLGEDNMKHYDIYWSKIDILDIILRIDLLKKKEKEDDSETK